MHMPNKAARNSVDQKDFLVSEIAQLYANQILIARTVERVT